MLPTIIFAAVILGLMTWGILAALNWYSEQQEKEKQSAAANVKPSPQSALSNAASSVNSSANNSNVNANTSGNTNTATEVPATPPGELAVQFKNLSAEEKPNITATIDGKYESFTFPDDQPKVYNPQNSIKISFSRWQIRNLQMSINGKAITLPEKPFKKGDAVTFVIDKNNIAKILQAGAITPESLGLDATGNPVPVANANANTATPATTTPKQ
jgi:hypothetical protein